MNKGIILAKKEVRRILKKFLGIIEFAYIYGSALTKNNPNDVDVLFVVKDENFKEEILFKINYEIKLVYKKYKDTLIHIQPIQNISSWWRLILKGEPWMIDSLSNPMILKDSSKVLKEVSEMVSKELTFKKEEIVEDLIERVEGYFTENKNSLLRGLSEISEAATEAMQIFLIFNDKIVLNKEKIILEIEENYSGKIKKEIIDFYREIIDLEEKVLNGTLTEFTSENLEYYKEKAGKVISYLEEVISK